LLPYTRFDYISAEPGHANHPGGDFEAGDIWFNRTKYNSNPLGVHMGNFYWHTFGHEMGHALGLEHGHDSSNPFDPLSPMAAPPNRDSMEFSIMTYRSYIGDPLDGSYSNATWDYAQTLMMDDIAAIQHLYGANYSHNSGDTTYTFSPTTGQVTINGVSNPQELPGANIIFRTIWDGDGNDTYDFSGYSQELTIDLRQGSWSDLDTGGNRQRADLGDGNFAEGHVYNALLHQGDTRSLIENALGGSNHDRIRGNRADNILRGGAGNDRMWGESGNDSLYGGSGGDLLWGESGHDRLYGYAGNDRIWGDSGNDNLFGHGDNDTLRGGSGRDTLNGGTGIDRLYGGDGDDQLYGGSGNDYLFGYRDNDFLRGQSGADVIHGNDGDDTVRGGSGGDYQEGGSGIDTLDYVDSTAGVNISLYTNSASGGYATGDTIRDFENVNGSNYNDTIRGSNDDNFIDGYDGDDRLYGLNGDDTLRGLEGDDVLFGGSGDDRLDGYGTFGTEFDRLTGGRGFDTFILGGDWGISYLKEGYATITDWNWEQDYIEVVGDARDYSLGITNFGIGTSALDTAIYYEGNVIAWVQDSTNINIDRDFNFVGDA
jgi:serralysin